MSNPNCPRCHGAGIFGDKVITYPCMLCRDYVVDASKGGFIEDIIEDESVDGLVTSCVDSDTFIETPKIIEDTQKKRRGRPKKV